MERTVSNRASSVSLGGIERDTQRETRINFPDYATFRRAKSLLLKNVGRNGKWDEFQTKRYTLRIQKMAISYNQLNINIICLTT